MCSKVILLVPEAGLEPARPCGQQILSLARLPIPPLGHVLSACVVYGLKLVHVNAVRRDTVLPVPDLPNSVRQSSLTLFEAKLRHAGRRCGLLSGQETPAVSAAPECR